VYTVATTCLLVKHICAFIILHPKNNPCNTS
jgi:hypothetical protein